MDIDYNLKDDTFMLYAIKAYDKPYSIMTEFESDLKRVKYIKRLLKKYAQSGELKERLILNHIIILSNVFGAEFTTKLLFYKIDSEYYRQLKTFLLYLGYMPDKIRFVNDTEILSSDIPLDMNVVNRLREL